MFIIPQTHDIYNTQQINENPVHLFEAKTNLNNIPVSTGGTKQSWMSAQITRKSAQKRSFRQYLTFVYPLRMLQKLNEFAGSLMSERNEDRRWAGRDSSSLGTNNNYCESEPDIPTRLQQLGAWAQIHIQFA
jgi:hypothetical protein